MVFGAILFSAKLTNAAQCATDGTDASVTVTASTADGSNVWEIAASGCPPWDWSSQTTPGLAEVQDWKAIIPRNPVISKNPIMINQVGNSVKGIVGMTMSGVAIFNALDRDDRDAYIYEGETMDECRGHVAQDTYHVHTLPGACCAFTEETDEEHSPFWGVMADGIPIAGPHGDEGNFPEDLDECMGHTDEAFPFYHYHTTGRLQYPFTANCLKGCVLYNFGNNRMLQNAAERCVPADTQYDFSSLEFDWDASPVRMSTVENCPYTYTLNSDSAPLYDMEPGEGSGDSSSGSNGGRPGGNRPPQGSGNAGRPGGNRPPQGSGNGGRPGGNRPPQGSGNAGRPGGNRPPQGSGNGGRPEGNRPR